MVAVQEALNPAPVAVPSTLDAIESSGETWRQRLVWPARPDHAAPALAGLAGRHLDAIDATDDHNVRDILRVVLPGMALPALIELAHYVAEEDRAGVRLIGPPVLDALRGDAFKPPAAGAEAPLNPEIGRLERRLRSIARTATWTPWWRLARTLFDPEAVALGHNSLLRAQVSRWGTRVRLDHIGNLAEALPGARLGADAMARADEAADRMLAKALDTPKLPAPMGKRIRAWLLPAHRAQARSAAALLDGLRSVRHLPRQLMVGTSGGLLGRALAVEVLRRDGAVTRFDHGGSAYLMPSGDSLASRELTVASAFAVASPKAAAMPPVVEAAARLGGKIVACAGDPGLDGAPAARGAASGRRRRVMYVSTALYRLRQVYPPVLPTPVYLDWQLRLVGMLNQLPVDLVCKPHPEGDRGGRQPLADVAKIVEDRFETAVADADVLVFDYPATTTLSVALSTDRPIVLIDHGTMRFNAPAAAMIADRCRVVPTTWNDRNLPEVDAEALADAVLGGSNRADPSDFRALFLDDG